MAAVADKAIGGEDQFVRRQTPSEAEVKYQSDVRKLVDLLSKLNPAAKEFFPSNFSAVAERRPNGRLSADAPIFVVSTGFYGNGLVSNGGSSKDSSSDGSSNNLPNRRRRDGFNQGRRRMNDRVRRAEREDSIRRTVYVSDVDQHVTEEKLAEIFANCGQGRDSFFDQFISDFHKIFVSIYKTNIPSVLSTINVVDCRICGDPHSVLRFAFIEFSDEDGARTALNLGGTVLGYYPVKVLPSKTAIMPVNPKFLPKSDDEKEMVVRTVYCTNIDKKVTQTDVKVFFQQCCGEVSLLRLLGDNIHSTHIAFVEFVEAESAIMALNCSGMVLGALPLRVSPSKTPVRPRLPRSATN